ncbi:MAG: TIGR01777 family oxidoreductase [Mangrovibacterium sp.]
MKIAISGASGFVGTYLSRYFTNKGYVISPLNRKIFTTESADLTDILSQADVVINLAGASINHRWTESYKKELYDSRIITTRKIVETINRLDHKPELLISASAVGYYPSTGCYDEYHARKGEGFLSDLCAKWEQEAGRVSPDVRLAITRLGVVLAPKGGAFEKMVLPARLGVSTIIGTGNQAFSWIDITDLADAMEFIINNSNIDGVVNLVAPDQITNKELMKSIAKHYHSLLTIKIPAFVFRILFGESAEFMTEGQCVQPKKLLESGFVFKSSTIPDFCSGLSE